MKYGYGFELTPGLVLLGVILVLPFVPGLALIAFVVVALAAVAALVALAGAIVATPYLLVRTVRGRRAEQRRHQSTEGSAPIATAIARAAPTTARRSQ